MSAEGAGLVPYKTSANADKSEGFVVAFDKQTQRENRLKRMKQAVWLNGYLHNMQQAKPGHRPPVPWFVTLTYDTRGTLGRGAHDWEPRHIAKATDAYRRWCRRRQLPCRYTWVAELQQKGTLHYHLIVWLPAGVRMPRWDAPTVHNKRPQAPFWPYGMANRQVAQSGIAYLMKYLSKMGKYHEFPEGCHIHGAGGLDEHGRLIRQWSNLPQWVKNQYGVSDVFRVKNPQGKSELVVLATGEALEPLYRRYLIRAPGQKPHAMQFIPTRDIPDRFHDGPWSTFYPMVGYPDLGKDEQKA